MGVLNIFMQSYIQAPDSWKAHSKGLEGGSGDFYTNSVRHIQNKPINFLYCRWCQLVTGRSFLWHLRPVTTVMFGSTSSVTVTQNEQHGKYSDTLIVPFRVQIRILSPPHCKEVLVNFSDPFNCSGVPWRQRILPVFGECSSVKKEQYVSQLLQLLLLSLLFVTWFKSL